jgi:hypothetical protein
MEYDATSGIGDDRFGLHKQVVRKFCGGARGNGRLGCPLSSGQTGAGPAVAPMVAPAYDHNYQGQAPWMKVQHCTESMVFWASTDHPTNVVLSLGASEMPLNSTTGKRVALAKVRL